jgi:hypothetical protein
MGLERRLQEVVQVSREGACQRGLFERSHEWRAERASDTCRTSPMSPGQSRRRELGRRRPRSPVAEKVKSAGALVECPGGGGSREKPGVRVRGRLSEFQYIARRPRGSNAIRVARGSPGCCARPSANRTAEIQSDLDLGKDSLSISTSRCDSPDPRSLCAFAPKTLALCPTSFPICTLSTRRRIVKVPIIYVLTINVVFVVTRFI